MPTAMSLLLLSLTLHYAAMARMLRPDDTPTTAERIHVVRYITKDGTLKTLREETWLVTKDAGRSLVDLRYVYEPHSTSWEVEEAATITKSGRHPVEARFIQLEPIPSPANGFDSLQQLKVAFPKVEVGTRTYVRLRGTRSSPTFQTFISEMMTYSDAYLMNAGQELTSELPLYVHINDPGQHLVVEQTEGPPWKLTVRLRTPHIEGAIEEEAGTSDIPDERRTWVQVSTKRNYPEAFSPLATDYEALIAEGMKLELPERNVASASPTESVVEEILHDIADKYRYLGDWRPIRGGHVPRSIREITQTAFGDCKDLSLLLVTRLRKVGVPAFPALVFRDERPRALPPLPTPAAFNHAIVWAKLNGRVLWLDPTNRTSFVHGVPDDIAARQALVLEAGNVRLENIPIPEPEQNRYSAIDRISFAAGGRARLERLLEISGSLVIPWTAAELHTPRQTLERLLASPVAWSGEVESSRASDLDLKSRATRPLKTSITAELRDTYTTSSAGPGFSIFPNYKIAQLLQLNATNGRVSDFYLGVPQRFQRKVSLRRHAIGRKLKSCVVDSPWIKASRTYTDGPRPFVFEERIDFRAYRIPLAAILSDDFNGFRGKLYSCLGAAWVITD